MQCLFRGGGMSQLLLENVHEKLAKVWTMGGYPRGGNKVEIRIGNWSGQFLTNG